MIVVGSLLHQNKAPLLEKVMGEVWNLQAAGQEFLWIVADNDADDRARLALHGAIGQATPGADLLFVQADLTGLHRPDATRHNDPRYLHSNPDHLVKMGRLRETVREQAKIFLKDHDYLFWLDLDTGVPEGGLQALLDFLSCSAGKFRPRYVSGVYPDRTTGKMIAQYWRGNPDPVQVIPGIVRPCSFNGLGCCLMEAEAVQAIGWNRYDKEPAKWVQGEDVVLFQNLEIYFGTPLFLHGGVLCSHYQDNGFAWVPALTNRGREITYIPDRSRMFEEATTQVYWIGREGAQVEIPRLGQDGKTLLTLHYNQPVEVSPEAARLLVDSPYYARKPVGMQL